MELLLLVALLGLIPGFIASSKGHSFLAWWFFGAMLFIIALPLSFFLKNKNLNVSPGKAPSANNPPMKKCPACAEEIQLDAIKCRYCGELLAEKEASLLFRLKKDAANDKGEYEATRKTLNQWLKEDKIQKFDFVTDPRTGHTQYAYQFFPHHFKSSGNILTKDLREIGNADTGSLNQIVGAIVSLLFFGFLLWVIL